MIPKRLFYEQLRIKGPMITPFLLNCIYCVVSTYSTLPDLPKSTVFYNRAKKLLDDFLDTPRVSTVAALCLMALYEPLPTKSRNIPDQHCRSWTYSGMAFRMCLELGLNTDTPHAHVNLPGEEIEFRRRVFWSCYCLDKMQSVEWERLWYIPISLAKTAFPQLLPGDDEEERCIVMTYERKIQLAIISEEGLQIRASFAIRKDIMDNKFHDQLEQYHAKILKWRDDLKSPELWGFAHCSTIEQVMNEPTKSLSLSYLHIIYYFMLIDTLFCLPDDKKKSLEQRIYASQLTKSVDLLHKQPSLVVRFELLARATIAALLVHSKYLNDPDPEVSCQSWGFFNQCIKILRKFQKHTIIPECSAVLTHLPTFCQKRRPDDPPSIKSDETSSLTLAAANGSPSPSFTEMNCDHGSSGSTNFQESSVLPQQQQAMYQSRHFDPYLTSTTSLPAVGYQNMDNMIMSPPYSLTAFGTTIGVDFGDRRQLWEQALQDILSEPKYDMSPSATTPESTTTLVLAKSFNNDWSNTSPRTTSEFTWPDPTHDRPQQFDFFTATLSTLHHQQQLTSTSLQQQLEHQIQHQQYNMPSDQQDMNYIYSYPTTTNDTIPCVQQQEQIQLSSPLNYPVVPDNLYAYYPPN